MNNNVNMSPKIIEGMQYKEFFGLYGSLPIAFTEKILYNSNEEDVFEFFNEIFARYITDQEFKYYKIVHSYIKYFKKYKLQNKNTIKLIYIDKRKNTIGKSKLKYIILGAKAPVYIENYIYNKPKLGNIILH